MKRWIVISSILVAAAGTLFVSRRDQLRAEQSPRTVAVARGSIAQEALAIGSIVPEQEISVKSKIPGIVSRLHVAIGDRVNEGMPLLDIRPDPTPLERAEAERSLQIARVTEDGALRDLERAQNLAEQGLLSGKELESAHQAHETARIRAQLEHERLQLLREGRANLEGNNVVSNRIPSPAAGTILTCDVHVGDPVVPLTSYQEGTVLMTLADMNGLIFRGTVDEVDVGRLSVGQPVRFTIGAIPEEDVRGRLRHISPKARRQDATTLFDIEAEITLPGEKPLRAGYSATARIAIASADSVLVIPERLVRFQDGNATVRVTGPEGKPVDREIVTGLSDGLTIEVREGLADGEHVLEPEPSKLEKKQ